MPSDRLKTPETVRLPMRVAVLTTKTPHHLYFLRELRRRCSDILTLDLVLEEDRPFPYRRLFFRHARRYWYNPVKAISLNPYLHIPYRAGEQDQFEAERFFPDGEYMYDSDVRVETVRSVNGKRAYTALKEMDPDLVLVYGTGLVKPHIFELPRITAINCHGGFLPDYRGLDTNIWAALKGEYDKMALTWHKLDQTFDTGPVLLMERLEPKPDMSIATLRYYTALLATDMCVRLLTQIAGGGVEATPQPPGQGRYYSFVPWILKPLADRRLRRFARRSTGDRAQ